MKKLFLFFVFVISITNVFAAYKYWVGGDNGDWNSTSSWSLTSGGTAGAGVPSDLDIVYFDQNSGNPTVNVADLVVNVIQIQLKTTGASVSVALNGLATSITLSGALTVNTYCTLNDGGNTITVGGNVAGTGTLVSTGSGKVIMNGAAGGTLTLAALASIGNFEVNCGTSANPVSISSTKLQSGCTFTIGTDGYLYSNSKTITAQSSGCNIVINGGVAFSQSAGLSTATSGVFPKTNNPTVILGPESTIEYRNTTAQNIQALNYANLKITGARGATNIILPAAKIGISGVLDLTGLSFTTGIISVNLNDTINFNNPKGGQTVPALFGSSYSNLIIGNSSGTQTLGAAITVNKVLTLDGKLCIGSHDLTIGASGSISGASSNGYIVTDGAGKLIQPLSATKAKLFPIGTSVSSYDPVTVSVTDSTSMAAKVSGTLTGTPASGTSYNTMEWSLTPALASSTVVSLAPSSFAAGAEPYFIGIYDGIGSYNNTNVTPVNGVFTQTITNFVSASPLLLVTGPKTITALNELSKSTINIFTNGDKLTVNGLTEDNALVLIYKFNGQQLKSFVINSNQNQCSLPQGVYVVKVKTPSELKVSKVIIQ